MPNLEGTIGEVCQTAGCWLALTSEGGAAVRIVTPTLGLVSPDLPVGPELLSDFATGSIDAEEGAYREPLLESARRDASELGIGAAVFLGSVATPRYVEPLRRVFGPALRIPRAFVGMGNMQRGSILLKAVEANRELEYIEAPEL